MKTHEKYLNEGRKYSTEEIIGIVDSEGLEYAIRDYLSWQSIEDPKLARAWKEASAALSKVENILGM